MKKILFISMMFISITSFSQDIITETGDTIVSINSEGIIFNSTDQIVGKILPNGNIQGAQNQLIGMVSGNEFKNSSGTQIAILNVVSNSQVQVKDINNLLLATVYEGVTIVGPNNEFILGSSEPINQISLAAYFFFFHSNSGN